MPLMQRPFAWLGALALGTIVSALMLVLCLKQLPEQNTEKAE